MPTILIVDDRRDAVEILQSKLQQKGFVTESTFDAREITGICERQHIDAIVMDMYMPELDGCEATELLKADEATSKIPVIICTAQPIAGDAERAQQAGCDGFIEKPIHLGTLLSILGQFFEVTKDVDVSSEEGEEKGCMKDDNDRNSSCKAAESEKLVVSSAHTGVPEPNLVQQRPIRENANGQENGLLGASTE